MANNIGKVVQVIGPVIDIRFDEGHVPNILNAIHIQIGDRKVVAEVLLHLGDKIVRCIALSATDGLARDVDAVDTGTSVTVPVGKEALGRMFNVTGDPIDGKGEIPGVKRMPIHREAPGFEDQKPVTQVFETGIKVIDLIAPYAKGGKIGLFGGAGVGKTVLIQN